MENPVDRIRKILVATDYSEDARRAENRAAMLSVELKADTLELMTVRNARMGLPTPVAISAAVEAREDEALALRERQEALPASMTREDGPACVRFIRTGSPPSAIVERAEEIGAGLIVVAARGKRFFADLFMRHNDDELIRLSDRPVLLVNAEPREAYRRVVVGVDFSAQSREAARMALAIAPCAHFTFVHAFRDIDEDMMLVAGVSADIINGYRMRARETARGELNRFIEELGPRKQLISRCLQHGAPVHAISAQAKRLNADLIAVGKHGKPRFVEFLLGSVTQRLIGQGLCDMLVTTSQDADGWDHPPAA